MTDQAAQDSFLHWLYTNAPAAWLSALVAFGLLILNLKLRKRPKILVVQENQAVSYTRFQDRMHTRLKMEWDGQPVKDPRMVRYWVANAGSETISKPEFTLALPSGTRILLATIGSSSQSLRREFESTGNKVKVCLDYANPKEHREFYWLQVITDGETSPAEVTGSGDGWSVRFTALGDSQEKRKEFFIYTAGASGIIGLITGAALWSFKSFVPYAVHPLQAYTILIGGLVCVLLAFFIVWKLSRFFAAQFLEEFEGLPVANKKRIV